MRAPSLLERVPMEVEVMLEKISAHKYSNMVAERRLTAMMLQEAVEWSGQACSPSTMRNQEKVAVSGVRELMGADPVLPYWGSSGGVEGVSNHPWLYLGVLAVKMAQQKGTILEEEVWKVRGVEMEMVFPTVPTE